MLARIMHSAYNDQQAKGAPGMMKTMWKGRSKGQWHGQGQGDCAERCTLPVQAMQRIAAASSIIRELIGPFCSILAVALLEIGFDLGKDVLPAIMHALVTGPSSATPSQSTCTPLRCPHCAIRRWRVHALGVSGPSPISGTGCGTLWWLTCMQCAPGSLSVMLHDTAA